MLHGYCKFGFIQESWWIIKHLNQRDVLFTAKGNCGGCFSIYQGLRGSKRGNNKEDFLGKKIEGLYESLRFEDLEIIQFQEGLKTRGFGGIIYHERF